MQADVIQGLWIGSRLSTMERMSIASFLKYDHEYHLYTYGPLEGLPAGAELRDARAILPESMIFQYRDHASYSGFSNYFRYKLLLEKGGWWVDTDTICLRSFDFDSVYVFASQQRLDGTVVAAASPIKAPAGSPALAYAWEACLSHDPKTLVWGETGPRLVTEFIERFDLDSFRQPRDVFCPLGANDWHGLLDPEFIWLIPESARAVHLWNELWRRHACDKDRDYPPGCLFETWKRTLLPSSPPPRI